MKKSDTLSLDRVRELLSYNPATGWFVWKKIHRSNKIAGERAGFLNRVGNMTGYRSVTVEYVRVAEHRLAWFYVYGVWPTYQIDHINGNAADNRIINLRDVQSATNKQNSIRPQKGNKSGFLGVTKVPHGYFARIHANGLTKHLGTFATADEAHAAYVEAKRKYHPGCTL